MSTTSDKIRISEIFGPTIQGEGMLIGQPTVFVRTGGCDYRCSWCDTLHAVDSAYRHDWKSMDAEAIWKEVRRLSGDTPLMVSLSGGNPAIQPLKPLIRRGKNDGYRFAIETQGSVARDWFADLDVLVLSPKPPSSGMETDWDTLTDCLAAAGKAPRIALKFVVFDDADYDFARDASRRCPELPVYLQPGNHTPPPPDDDDARMDLDGIMDRMLWLVDKVTGDRWFSATVLPQLHVLLWGNKRGV
ncbi:7-carboxy-7-deazaguanine synthase QueE [Aliirhizobium terrae]|uniref:7-carboxy-7-deazaguanine synthase QueE n=1 Tax=Terrirhizobium terrae TaxID=2926709 RepID=UPI0025763A3D|nr:7-carboxy-7-deazaguanine synthase QueE [Rhizobium sp. CC-CFT758]WJH40778.1 7-carboxy-7-deazaguanine synthase QueE [Rhizobium sp. CC-CFT758]